MLEKIIEALQKALSALVAGSIVFFIVTGAVAAIKALVMLWPGYILA